MIQTPRVYARGVAMLNGPCEKAFDNPIKEAFLTSIFLRQKRLRYLETYLKTMASLPNSDKGSIDKAFAEYHDLLFPEDTSRVDFVTRATEKLKWWKWSNMRS